MNNCDSCGMPLDDNSKSKHGDKYCIHCQNQESGDLKSFEEVREGCIGAAMKMMGKSREEAETMANEMLPKLPRWKDK